MSSIFENVPTICFVYISEFDVFGQDKTTDHVDNAIRDPGTIVMMNVAVFFLCNVDEYQVVLYDGKSAQKNNFY